MFLPIIDQISIVLCYRDALIVEGGLLDYDKREVYYKDHMNSNGINYSGVEHLAALELGRLLDETKYNQFSYTELEGMM
jgi:hypothetical protein